MFAGFFHAAHNRLIANRCEVIASEDRAKVQLLFRKMTIVLSVPVVTSGSRGLLGITSVTIEFYDKSVSRNREQKRES